MSVKYNMQPSDWSVYRDFIMTSPYDDVIIHKLQYAITWLVEHTGGEGGRQAVTERREKKKKKNKNKKRKRTNKKVKLKLKRNKYKKEKK